MKDYNSTEYTNIIIINRDYYLELDCLSTIEDENIIDDSNFICKDYTNRNRLNDSFEYRKEILDYKLIKKDKEKKYINNDNINRILIFLCFVFPPFFIIYLIIFFIKEVFDL